MTKILVADDNGPNRSLLQTLLTRQGYDVIAAADGAEALDKARENRPDMIISDILMPGMDGFALCRQWKHDEMLKEVPFVFYTSTYTDSKDRQLAQDLGAERFIVKPVEQQAFLNMITEIIEDHKAGRQTPPREPVLEETVYLKEYNAALVRKLGDKVVELESAKVFLERELTEHKRAEETLRFQGAIVSEMSEGVSVVRARDLVIAYANPRFEAMFGYNPGELAGKHVSVLNAPAERSPAETANLIADALRTSAAWQGDILNVTKDGRVFWCHASVCRFEHPEYGKVFIAVHSDITERRRADKKTEQAEHDLQTSETRYRRLFESAKDGILILDADTGQIVDVNPFLCELLGFDRAHLLGMKIWEIGLFKDIAESEASFLELQEKGYVRYDDLPLETSDGRRIETEFVSNVYLVDSTRVVQCNIRDITVRRRALEALEQSESKFRILFDGASDGMILLDLETRKFLMCNAMCLGLLGYTREEFLDLDIAALHPPEDVPFLLEQMEEFVNGNHSVRSNIRFRRKDGTILFADLSPALITLNGRKCSLLDFRDITERRRAEEALRQSEERHRTILETAMDGFWVVDMQGCLLEVNDAYCRMSGYSEQELLGMRIPDLDANETEEAATAHFQKIIAQGEDRFESRHCRKNGSILYVEVTVQYKPAEGGRFVAFLHDLTKRKQAEEALRTTQQIIEGIINTIPVRVFWKDKNLAYLGCNAAFAHDAGFADPKDLIGKDDYQMVWRDHAETYRHDDRQVLESGQSRLLIEELQTTPEGNTITLLTSKLAMHNPKGEVVGIIGTYVDITERKQAEAEKAGLEAQLQQAQKMESVGRLAGGVAHDFNNMLAVILGYAEVALDQVSPGQPIHADLEEIRKAGKRAADLTRQLLTFARKQTVMPRILDLNEAVGGMLKMLQRLIGEDIQLRWHPKANLWPILMDPSQMDQILANLCVNARDAIADVGRITIETENRSIDEHYCAGHAGFAPGEYVLLAVSDNGCGMDKETLSHLFEPFFTTKEMGKGTGLGLATLYGIVKQNSGHIHVYSEVGHGTAFTIYLPRHAGASSQAGPERPSEPLLRGQETILLVEDELSLLQLTATTLKRQGYTVLAASGPDEAIL